MHMAILIFAGFVFGLAILGFIFWISFFPERNGTSRLRFWPYPRTDHPDNGLPPGGYGSDHGYCGFSHGGTDSAGVDCGGGHNG
jgi:hypothetical protein